MRLRDIKKKLSPISFIHLINVTINSSLAMMIAAIAAATAVPDDSDMAFVAPASCCHGLVRFFSPFFLFAPLAAMEDFEDDGRRKDLARDEVRKRVSFVCLVIVDSINNGIECFFDGSINFETDLHYLLIIKVNTDFDVGFDADIDINKDTTYPCIILVDIDYS